MAQLRTSFVQTCNSSSSIFSCMSGVINNIGSLFNNDDKQEIANLRTIQDQSSVQAYWSLNFCKSNKYFMTDLQRSVHSLINLNINSLSQLMDNESTDFKGNDDFIHILQIQDQSEEQKQNLIESLETINSVDMQMNQFGNLVSPNSTQVCTQFYKDDVSEVSDVDTYQF